MTQAAHPATTPTPLPPADVDRLADEIAEVASHIDAAVHRLLSLIRRFDEGSGWATHGALSCAHWLNWRIGLDLGAARERVRVARALGALPVLDDALRRGTISYSKTRAITRVATAASETTLLEMAQHATASQLEKICRGYRRVLGDQQRERPESLADEEQRCFVRASDTDDGMVRIEARLRPEEARVVMQALEVARRRAWRSADADVSAETSPRARRTEDHGDGHGRRHVHEPSSALSRADALVAVAEALLSTEAETRATRGADAAPIELIVHVDEAALRLDPHAYDAGDDGIRTTQAPHPTRLHATLDDGTAIGVATAQRLACDAAVVAIAEDAKGNVHTLTRRTRGISSTLRRALRVRDDGCRFPAARIGSPTRTTWSHGRAAGRRSSRTCARSAAATTGSFTSTATGSSVPPEVSCASSVATARRCRRRGCACYRRPRAQTAQTPGRTPTDPLAVLRDAHAARDLAAIDGHTAFPGWDGTPVDYGLAVQALLGAELASPSPG